MITLANIRIGQKVEIVDEISQEYHKQGIIVDYDYNSVSLKLDKEPDTVFICGREDILPINF